MDETATLTVTPRNARGDALSRAQVGVVTARRHVRITPPAADA